MTPKSLLRLLCSVSLLGTAALAEETVPAEETEPVEQIGPTEILDEQDDDVARPREPEEADVGKEIEQARRPVVEFYGKADVIVGSDGDVVRAQDNTSRFGLFAAKPLRRQLQAYARLEMGVNVVDSFNRGFNPGNNAPEDAGRLILRLGYFGFESDWGRLTFGKQWSVSYPIAAFTDRFAWSGGLASGAFAAGTDGGAVGTGRADAALKYAAKWNDLDLKLQWQAGGNPIPHTIAKYDFGFGGSTIYEWLDRVSLGFAVNHAHISLTEDLREAGIEGNANNVLGGLMYRWEPLYVAAIYSYSENHNTDNEGTYIDDEGVEVYARWAIRTRYRVVAGFNYVEPRRQSEGGRYDIRLGIVGVQYAFLDPEFRSALFAEYLIDESQRSDGSEYPHAFALGIRWAFAI